jgi:UDP-GlcNAc:undecaprenyl-phosphate/decaprenyl-phosphate GlcNAc-1-phosphate transferase
LTIAERLVLSLLLASGVVYLATPLVIVLADRLSFYDRPVGYKAHARPTPYLGGAAVMAGFLVALLSLAGEWDKTLPLIEGVALLWVVGTVDDRRNVSPWLRVAVELALAWVVWRAGLGFRLHAGSIVDLAVTSVWIVAVVNAFNLFDNMDGAAGTMALVVCAGAAILGVVRADAWVAVGAAALGGACLGFLPRNLSLPARIFLGDGGSMPIGFAVAVLVMFAAATAAPGWRSLPLALLLVGLPALDTALVIVSRRRRGASVLSGGQDHLTHRTRRLLPSARAVALGLGGAQAMVSVAAVLATEGGAFFVVLAAAVYAIAALCAVTAFESIGAATARAPGLAHDAAVTPASQIAGTPSLPPITAPSPAAAGDLSPQAIALLALLGLGAGLSPFWFAYYGSGVWVPMGLGIVLLCAIARIARPMRPGAPARLAVFGLLGIGLWSLCSTAWTESVEGAVASGNRWLVYGALLLLLVVLVRSRRRAALLLAAAAVGVIAVALYVLANLLGADPAALFLGGRLNLPLGYINGEGCLFAMGFWLCLAAAEARSAWLAGPAAAMATLMAALALLTQSRGTALAMLATLVAVMALVPGRTRRAYALMTVATGVALAAPNLLHVYASTSAGIVPAAAVHAAGRSALASALGVGALWGGLTGAWRLLAERPGPLAQARTAAAGALAVPALIAALAAFGAAHTIDREARAQWRAFTHLSVAESASSPSATPSAARAALPSASAIQGRSRLLSGAGNRYDYWRIAWRVWTERPLLGVGGGGYARFYFQRRATAEDVDQPHSLELELLAELGVGGALLLACFAGAVGWGVTRMRRRARDSSPTRIVLVAATGAFGVWLIQASFDWMHRLPGLTAIALIAAAALVWPRTAGPPAGADGRLRATRLLADPRRARTALTAAALATLVVAGGTLARQGLAEIYAKRAEGEIAAQPAAAIADANRSLDIDSDAVSTYYVKAAALARFDQAAATRATLRAALAHEPDNFVTWALLGDIAVRERSFAAARRLYTRALELNPRDASLRALAADPR